MFNPRIKDETGNVYGRLTVLRMYDRSKDSVALSSPGAYWVCRCECGNETIVYSGSLRKGQTRSCGCLRSELAKERFTKIWANYRESRAV